MRAAAFSVAAAVSLCALKLAAGLLTGSLGVLSSAFDSLADIFMSTVNLLSIRASAAPADAQHPYGHGKVESLATVFQAVVIGVTGVWVLREGVARLAAGRAPAFAEGGMAVMLFGTVASAWVSRRIRKAGEETGSPALLADSAHFATDVWSNGGILLALLLFRFTGWKWIDPAVAMAVGGYILFVAGGILVEAAQELVDRTLPEDRVARIREIIEGHSPVVVEVHDLRTRRSGADVHVDFHLVLCRDLSLEEAHRVADHVEEEVRRYLGGGGVICHLDPCRLECGGPTECSRGLDREMIRTLDGPESRGGASAGGSSPLEGEEGRPEGSRGLGVGGHEQPHP